MKRLNHRNKNILMTVVVVVLLSLSFAGVFAAYISRSYVKGVATTPKQGFILSSDYLAVVSRNTEVESYPDKKILLTEKEESDTTPYVFTFTITNSADGTISNKRVQYYLKMSGLPEGTTVKYGDSTITSNVQIESGYKAPVMNAYTRVTHTYTISIPKDKFGSATDITVTATPDADSDNSGYILAGKLQPSIVGTIASFSFDGHLIETGNVGDYAAFNYQISVSNAGDGQIMNLTWNNAVVEIDPLFLEKIGNQGGNSGSLTLTMGDSNSNYLIQFYRIPGGSITEWNDLGLKFEPAVQ